MSQNHPQDHQNHLQDYQNHTYKEPPKGGLLIGVVLMVLEVILVVLGVVLRQCSEQMFGTDSGRNTVPSQHRAPFRATATIFCTHLATILSFILAKFGPALGKIKVV